MERKGFLGGSDVSSILGLSRWTTEYETYEIKMGLVPSQEDTEFFEISKDMEPIAAKYYMRKSGNKVILHDPQPLIIHPEFPMLGCHLDGDTILPDGTLGVFEAKSVASTAFKNWKEEIPIEYYCQLQHNLFCSQRSKGAVSIIVMDSRQHHIVEYDIDVDYATKQANFLKEWWNKHIVNGEAPIPSAEDYDKMVSGLYDLPVEAEAEEVEAYLRLLDIKEQLKSLEGEKEKQENILKEKLGMNVTLMHGLKVLATWKLQSAKRVDSKLLRDQFPDIAKQVEKESSFRVLRLKEDKS